MTPPLLSIVAPCYNEADSLPEFYHRVSEVCRKLQADYEIVLVDDGSRDATWPAIASLAATDARVMAIRLSRNHGHQLALTAGLFHCRGERILILDADLQDPPELLSAMMAEIDSGADVAYGRRKTRTGESGFKRGSAYLFYRFLNWFTDVPIPEDTGDFRLMTRRVLDVFKSMPENHRFIRGMISWVGFRQVPVYYDRAPRFAGSTSYPLRKMIRFGLDAITSFSVKPLRIAFVAGILLCALSLALLVYALFVHAMNETIRGWTSLMAVVLILLGAQFLFLGLIGEYLGRLYLEIKHRPLFVIEEVINGESKVK